MCWSVLWLGQLQDLSYTVKTIDSAKRGGELISIIAPFAYCANPYLQQMATNIIKVVSVGKCIILIGNCLPYEVLYKS